MGLVVSGKRGWVVQEEEDWKVKSEMEWRYGVGGNACVWRPKKPVN